MGFIKILLYIFNIIFVLVGITLAGIGIWTAADKIFVSYIIGDSLFSAASYTLIVVGVITIAICILGIYSLAKEHLKIVVLYFALLIFAAILLLSVAVLAVVFKGEVEDAMVSNMRDTLIGNYGKDRDVTDAWDEVQKKLKCCAISQKLIGDVGRYKLPYVDGTYPKSVNEKEAQDMWPIYKRTQFYNVQKDYAERDKKYVPESCCVLDEDSGRAKNVKFCQNFPTGPPTNYIVKLNNRYLYEQGCYEKAKSLVSQHADILLAMGFVFAFVMIAGIVMTFIVMRQISGERVKELRRRREPDNL